MGSFSLSAANRANQMLPNSTKLSEVRLACLDLSGYAAVQ